VLCIIALQIAGLLAIAQSVTENIQTGSSDSASQELVWPGSIACCPRFMMKVLAEIAF
jgi:hypothetical protein